MAHDATKVLMGTTKSSAKHGSEVFASDPATYLAGLAVRRANTGLLSVTKAAGKWVGISLGKSLSDHKKTTVLMSGAQVPVLLEAAPARGIFDITSYANLVAAGNDTIKIGATTFTFKTSPSTESEVLCAASASSNTVVAAALVAKINAHSVAGTLFHAANENGVVTITAKNNATLGASVDLVYTDSGTATVGGATFEPDGTTPAVVFTGGAESVDYVQIGASVYFSDTTGKADDPESGATISNAIYVSEPLTGITEAGTEVAVALVDMVGGL